MVKIFVKIQAMMILAENGRCTKDDWEQLNKLIEEYATECHDHGWTAGYEYGGGKPMEPDR